jgi:hypothetical protein
MRKADATRDDFQRRFAINASEVEVRVVVENRFLIGAHKKGESREK